jgi:trehalose-6-phosphatase
MEYGILLKEYFAWHYVSVVKRSVLQTQTAHCINKHNAKSSVQIYNCLVEI